MLKLRMNWWQFLVIEPYSWLLIMFVDAAKVADALPEKMSISGYFGRVLRVALPFFSLLYLCLIVGMPAITLWNGNDLPSHFPFAKLALVGAGLEALVLTGGVFFRTRLGFLVSLCLSLAGTIGLALAIVTL